MDARSALSMDAGEEAERLKDRVLGLLDDVPLPRSTAQAFYLLALVAPGLRHDLERAREAYMAEPGEWLAASGEILGPWVELVQDTVAAVDLR